MVEFSLGWNERMIISSHAQFRESKSSSQLKTGDAFLTDRRFAFMGRLQVKSIELLAAVAIGQGTTYFEIPASALMDVRKKILGSSIEISYREASKEKKVLLKPERIRYLGTILGFGIGAAGGEIGKMVGDSLLERTGEIVGEKIGEKAGEFVGQQVERTHAKSLVDMWLKAFGYVIQQQGTSSAGFRGFTEPEKVTRVGDPNIWRGSAFERHSTRRPKNVEERGYKALSAREESIGKVDRCEECPNYQSRNEKYGFCTMKNGLITGKHKACSWMRE